MTQQTHNMRACMDVTGALVIARPLQCMCEVTEPIYRICEME